MPAATLGRFRFYLSTDDLFFPHAFNAGLYGVVFCVFSTVFYIALALFSTHAKKCTDTEFTADFHLVRATGFILSGIFLLHFLCSCCCAWIACKGAPPLHLATSATPFPCLRRPSPPSPRDNSRKTSACIPRHDAADVGAAACSPLGSRFHAPVGPCLPRPR